MDLKEDLMVKAGLLEQNIPSVKPILEDAQDHADDLQRQAERLDRYSCVNVLSTGC